MKLLHTSDWHVGKQMRGRSRLAEHEAVLGEIVAAAAEHQVDAVLIAGDLFETSTPTAEAEALVYKTLLALADTGADVAIIAGNHDNAGRIRAISPVLEAAGSLHVASQPMRPEQGGVRTIETRSGERLRLAMLPFVSQRGIVRARDLMDAAAFEQVQAYADRSRLLIDSLTVGFDAAAVNVLMAHTFVLGGAMGGGERLSHFSEEYAVPAQAMPATASYVALGHLHRPQRIDGPGAIHYCGSPLQLDFGEEEQAKQVNLVEVSAGVPAAVTPLPLKSGWRLRTLAGSLSELRQLVGTVDDHTWLRVRVEEAGQAGLNDTVRDMFGDAVVEVRVDNPDAPAHRAPTTRHDGRAPQALFEAFLAEQGIDDKRITDLFVELLEAEVDAASGSL